MVSGRGAAGHDRWALLSEVLGGSTLLVASGAVLIPVGWRVVRPIKEGLRHAGSARRQFRPVLVAASAAVGLFTGLLANGGGFLLVPMYLLLFGLTMAKAAGTSLLVISVLTVPTLVTHWAHIDWAVAGAFALGAVPASMLSGIAAANAPPGQPPARRLAGSWSSREPSSPSTGSRPARRMR
jgi:uncharacterized membrane protein YfcA